MDLTVFEFEGHQIRVVGTAQNPFWVAQDVCTALGLKNAGQVCRRLKDYEKRLCVVETPGGNQNLLCVSESGLYRLVLSSRKPQAEIFQDWILGIISTLRKSVDFVDFLNNSHQYENEAGFVYLATMSKGWCKIGMSKQPYKRMSSLPVGTPLEITLVHRIFTFNMSALEKALHDYYGAYWLRGEWFDLPQECIEEFPMIANKLDSELERICLPGK